MKRMIILVGTALMLALPASLSAADVTGDWVAEAPGGQQGDTVELKFTFKVDGETLTGTLDNPQAGPTDIKDGKIVGDDISFHVVRDIMGSEMKVMWTGKVVGKEIKFQRTIDMSGFDGGGGGGFGGGQGASQGGGQGAGQGGGQGAGGGAPKAAPDIIAKRVP